MAVVAGKSAKVRYTSLVGTSSTNNAATRTTGAGSAGGKVQINSTAKRHWDRNSTGIALYRTAAGSTTLVGSSAYSINHVQGIFQWPAGADPDTGTYTIDTVHLTSSYLAGCQSWSLNFDVDMYETTAMSTSTGDAKWRTFVPGLASGSIDLSRFITGTTGPVAYDYINADGEFIVELITNNWNKYECYARMSADGIQTGIDGVTVESVGMVVDGTVYYSTA